MWNRYRIAFQYAICNPHTGTTIHFNRTEYVTALSRQAAIARIESMHAVCKIVDCNEY